MVTFPTYKVADQLLQSYELHVVQLCPIVHLPSLRSLLKTSYVRINQHESVPPGQAALLLSILAIAAFFYPPSAHSDVATTEQDTVNLCRLFSKSALDVQDHSRRNTSGSLEDIQACIILSHVFFHLEGFSARGRLLLTTAASIAKDLRLHRLDIDDGESVEQETEVCVLIEREITRRVFWYIASTDW